MQQNSKKILLFTVPGYGHMYPTMNVVKELVEKGNTVFCYSTEEFKEMIEQTGATFISYNQTITIDPHAIENPVILGKQIFVLGSRSLDTLLDAVNRNKPDLILHDALAFWGKVIGKKINIPSICYVTTCVPVFEMITHNLFIAYAAVASIFSSFPEFISLIIDHQLLQRKYKVNLGNIMNVMLNSEKLTIVFTSRQFQPYSKKLDSSFYFVGPSIKKRLLHNDLKKILEKKKNIIYISLGTIYNQDIQFYNTCIRAFKHTEFTVVMSIGKSITTSQLDEIPSNFIVKNYVSQLDILQKASVFITHGGLNSTQESIYFGVPMLFVPQMIEQKCNALRAQELHLGKILEEKTLTAEKLQQEVTAMLHEKTYKKSLSVIRNSFIQAGGYKKAADAIESYPLIK